MHPVWWLFYNKIKVENWSSPDGALYLLPVRSRHRQQMICYVVGFAGVIRQRYPMTSRMPMIMRMPT